MVGICPLYIGFVMRSQRHQRLMEQDQNMWWETLGKLQIIIRKSAIALSALHRLTPDQKHNYFMSGRYRILCIPHPLQIHWSYPQYVHIYL